MSDVFKLWCVFSCIFNSIQWWFWWWGWRSGFFVNRASSRASERIELLEAWISRSGKKNALLRRRCEANEPEKEAEPATAASEPKEDEDIIRLVANDNAYRGANSASAATPHFPVGLSALPFATDTTASTPYIIYGFICNIVLYV